MYILASFLNDYERYTHSLTCKDMNKILKSKNHHLFFKKEDLLLSWDSYEIDSCWVNLKYYKIKDEDCAAEYYTEGRPKDCNEKISFLDPYSLIPSTKDSFFSNEKKYEYCTNSLHECLVQIKKR